MADRQAHRTADSGETPQSPPASLYELLIYDNKKLAERQDEPHLILRRNLRGQRNPFPPAGSPAPLDEAAPPADDAPEALHASAPSEEPAETVAPQADHPDTAQATPSAFDTSSYIASLGSGMSEDVERVVATLVQLEAEDDQASADSGELLDPEQVLSETADLQTPDLRVTDEKAESRRGVNLSDIFSALRSVREKGKSPKAGYTKKVEYEDR